MNGKKKNVSKNTNVAQPEMMPVPANENYLLGIIGALFLGLIGGAVYVILFQLNIIPWIMGPSIYCLAFFGYRQFSGVDSKASIIVAVIVTLLVTASAEYISVVYWVFADLEESNPGQYTLAEVFSGPFRFIPDDEGARSINVVKDLLLAYGLSAVPTFLTVKSDLRKE